MEDGTKVYSNRFFRSPQMKGKTLAALCSIGMTLAILFLIGANPGPRAATPWEYGIYTQATGNYDWQDATRRVQATNPTDFFARMGFPTGIEVDARTGRIPALMLNYLGQQGWELVDVRTIDARRDTYWFKRPR